MPEGPLHDSRAPYRAIPYGNCRLYTLLYPLPENVPKPHEINKDADKFVKMVEVYVRGNSIKYVTIPDEVLDMVQEEDLSKESESALEGVAVDTPRSFYVAAPFSFDGHGCPANI